MSDEEEKPQWHQNVIDAGDDEYDNFRSRRKTTRNGRS
jgi:hypothetical protein